MRRVSPSRSTSTQWPRPCSALSVGMRRAWACVKRVAIFSSTRRLSMKLSTTVVTESRSTSARLTRVRRKPGESDEKGPDARRRPMAAREAYSLYVERAGEGGNEADGPLSSLSPGFRRTPVSLAEVERLSVTTVVDNFVDSLRADEKIATRFTHAQARRMPTLKAEHGLGHWVEV